MKILPWHRHEPSAPHRFDLDDLFDHLWGKGNGRMTRHLPEVFRHRAFPAVNIAETEDGFTITMDCPGMEREEIEIEAMGAAALDLR